MSTAVKRIAAPTVAAIALASACSGSDGSVDTDARSTTVARLTDVIDELPPDSRNTTTGGAPRSTGHWIEWSSCGPGSRADEAVANGGVAAGWYLVDDLLADPGVALGDHLVADCDAAVEVLDAPAGAAFDGLAAALLAAELNLGSGAEVCEAADQAARAAQIALAGLGYAGPGTVEIEPEMAALQLIDLLDAYNAGELCT